MFLKLSLLPPWVQLFKLYVMEVGGGGGGGQASCLVATRHVMEFPQVVANILLLSGAAISDCLAPLTLLALPRLLLFPHVDKWNICPPYGKEIS